MKTLKSLLMLGIAALLFGGCSNESDDNNKFTLTASRSEIMANVEYSQLSVKLGKKELSAEEFVLYNEKGQVVNLPNLRFTSDTPGSYSFQAYHPTLNVMSDRVKIRVIKEIEFAEAPADEQPSNLNFTRAAMYIRFTGTNCGACPILASRLQSVLPEYEGRIYECTIHQYNSDDPAFLASPQLGAVMGVDGYPYSVMDLNKQECASGTVSSNYIKQLFNNALSRVEARAAIAASTRFDEEAQAVAVTVKIKANTPGEYRVGAWLLEDDVYGQQVGTTNKDLYFHDNCTRVVDSHNFASDYSGHSIGSLNSGEYGDKRFVFSIDDMWNVDNCHIAIFVSSKEGDKFFVNNIIDIPVKNGSVKFKYAE